MILMYPTNGTAYMMVETKVLGTLMRGPLR